MDYRQTPVSTFWNTLKEKTFLVQGLQLSGMRQTTPEIKGSNLQ